MNVRLVKMVINTSVLWDYQDWSCYGYYGQEIPVSTPLYNNSLKVLDVPDGSCCFNSEQDISELKHLNKNISVYYTIKNASCYLKSEPLDPTTQFVYLDIALWTSNILTFTVGNALLGSIVHYEWYGGDPQKRSLGNRLGSHLVLCLMAAYMLKMGRITLLRYGTGRRHQLIHDLIMALHYICFLCACWFANAITSLRYIQVVIWKRVREINEELTMRAIGISFYCMAGVLTFATSFDKEYYETLSQFSNTTVEVPMSICQYGTVLFDQR